MFSYVEKHRNGLQKAAGIAGGIYLVRGYIKARLEEVKENMEQDRVARDILQRRYEQTQEDVGYTVMALLSSLGEQILEEMDVEAIIGELQMMSNKSSLAASATSDSAAGSSLLNTSGLQGWVDASASQAQSQASSQAEDSSGEESSSVMSGSFMTNISASESEPSSSSASVASLPSTSTSSSTSRTKAQLWNSVKLLTFTRTLTTIYSVSLLTLFTLTQLTILARAKYIRAIRQMSAEQDQEAMLHGEMTVSNMLLMAVKAKLGMPQQPLFKTLFPSVHDILFASDDEADLLFDDPSLDRDFEALSAKFLTLSYYLLHIGWKDLSARVQPAVEDALEGVSLKTRLSKSDVHRILKDIIRRVALDGSFESAMLPTTEEMVRNVLVLGGFEDHDPHSSSATSFHNLLSETRALFASSDFVEVQESCVDFAVDGLMSSLEADGGIFAPEDDEDEPKRVRLASILPPLASLSRTALLALPSELVDGLLAKNEVRCFSAWIWAKFELEA